MQIIIIGKGSCAHDICDGLLLAEAIIGESYRWCRIRIGDSSQVGGGIIRIGRNYRQECLCYSGPGAGSEFSIGSISVGDRFGIRVGFRGEKACGFLISPSYRKLYF